MEDMEEGEGEQTHEADGGAARIFDNAARNSHLPIPEIPLEVGSLGSGAGCLFAAQMLANSGIVVELVGGDVETEEGLMEFTQIVNEDEIGDHLKKFDQLEEVCLMPMHRMLGYQIKLDGQRKWKVKCADENKEHHNPSARSARYGSSDSFREYKNHDLHEIFIPHRNDMRATIAVSNVIVITVLFKVAADGECKWSNWAHGTSSPPVYQRRVDMLFHNKYCGRLQTVFLDEFAADLSGEPNLTDLMSSSSWAVDNLFWEARINKDKDSEEDVFVVAACGGYDLNSFFNGTFGPRKNFGKWLNKDEAFVIKYLQSAHASGTNGEAIYAVPGQLDDKIEDLFYEEWNITTKFFLYNLQHEPLFTTLDSVNRLTGESLDIYVCAAHDAEFLATGSVDYMDSITAFAISQGRPTRKRSGPSSAKHAATTAKPPKERTVTDGGWKGVWQGIMERYGKRQTLPPLNEVVEKLKLFHSDSLSFKSDQPAVSFAPFKKVILLEKYKDKLDEETLGDAINSWLEGIFKKSQPKKRPSANLKRRRDAASGSVADTDERDDRLVDDEDELDASRELMDALDNKRMASLRADITKMSSKLTSVDTKTESLDARVTNLAETCADLESTSRLQVSALGDRAATITLTEHQKLLAEKDELITTAKKHEGENRMLIGILGTVFSQTRTLLSMATMANQATGNTTAVATTLADELTAPMYTQIITMVNDTWAWTPAQKRSIYGAFQQIAVFKTEYEKVKE